MWCKNIIALMLSGKCPLMNDYATHLLCDDYKDSSSLPICKSTLVVTSSTQPCSPNSSSSFSSSLPSSSPHNKTPMISCVP